MTQRDPNETHRASTPLELLFDLTFVVAIAQCAASLHHGLSEGRVGDSLQSYPLVFFAIWWAWMNFTWFASAYDIDDLPYRMSVLVQMAGVLVLAAGVPRAFEAGDFGVVTLGYAIMRVGLVSQWVRVARDDPAGRPAAVRYAAGITVLQIGWVALLAVPDGWRIVGFLVLGAAELSVPAWAERASRTSWHPSHIAERYGLFTIIVLGESVLAATLAVQQSLDDGASVRSMVVIGAGGLLIVFSLWSIYFDQPIERATHHARSEFSTATHHVFVWGYGHYFVFASAAAVGGGIAASIDAATGHAELSDSTAAWALTVPVALFVLAVWAVHVRHLVDGRLRLAGPVVALAVLAVSPLPGAALVVGLGLLAFVVFVRPAPIS